MEINKDILYGTLGDRVRALIFDMVVIAGLGVATALILDGFENVPDYVRGLIFILIFFLYDPVMISSFGGTIGHLSKDIRVRRESDNTKKILLPVAIVRFAVKLLLGTISLLTVTGNIKGKAIHDSVAGSVVVKV